MARAIKFKNNEYLDSTGIVYKRKLLKDVLSGIVAADMNDCTDTGIYFIDESCRNRPEGFKYGTLIVFSSTANGAWTYIQQMFISNYDVNNKRFALRTIVYKSDNRVDISSWRFY